MSKNQRIVVYVCLAIMVLMLVFPPMRITHTTRFAGYAFFTGYGNRHTFWNWNNMRGFISLDLYRLAMQLLMVSLTGAGVFMAARGKK